MFVNEQKLSASSGAFVNLDNALQNCKSFASQNFTQLNKQSKLFIRQINHTKLVSVLDV